jgi:hypothetical protein
MCIICIELDKARMSPLEARRALGEMRATLEPGHAAEVEAKVKEVEAEAESDDSTSKP